MKQIKPWLSYKQQLKQLQARGLQVEDVEAALDYLKRVGYYRLSGYWHPLRTINQKASDEQNKAVRMDTFIPGSRFEDVVRLYVFDKKLRLLALDALERIELAVRVDVAHLLGQIDPLAYQKPDCLHGNFTKKAIQNGRNAGETPHQIWLSNYDTQLQRARKEPFVAHHMEEYGALPIWVAIEIWDFGLLSKLFAGMKHADQNEIARRYGAPNGRTFAQWLRSLNFIRNISAHHSRLWNINVLELSPIPPSWPREIKQERPFFYFCLVQHLLQTICPKSSWGMRLKALLKEEFPSPFHLTDFGTLSGWEQWSLWQQQNAKK
jgi:abortive infection bacteriophage resistance protein